MTTEISIIIAMLSPLVVLLTYKGVTMWNRVPVLPTVGTEEEELAKIKTANRIESIKQFLLIWMLMGIAYLMISLELVK